MKKIARFFINIRDYHNLQGVEARIYDKYLWAGGYETALLETLTMHDGETMGDFNNRVTVALSEVPRVAG